MITEESLEELRQILQQEEEPCIGEPECFGCCSAATYPKAIENLIELIKYVDKLPTWAMSGRTGSVYANWLSKDSFYDGMGHYIGATNIDVQIGPDECSEADWISAIYVVQGKEKASDSTYPWQSQDKDEIYQKVKIFAETEME